MFLSFLIASIPVAPFTSPYLIEIPNGFPPRTIPPQIFRKVDWLDNRDDLTTSDKYKTAKYVGLSRRQGNIISLYVLDRTLLRETAEQNRNSKNVHAGAFIPSYMFWLKRFDCANDRYSMKSLVATADAIGDGPEVKGAFEYPTNSSYTEWALIPFQQKVVIEGNPYWASAPFDDPRFEEKPEEWINVNPGTYGASHIDYACANY